MKLNPILFLIFLLLAAVLAWAGFEMCSAEKQSWAMAVVVGIGLTVAGTCFAADMGNSSANVNCRAAAAVYVVVSLVVNSIFTFFEFSIPALVIPNLLLLVALLLVVYMVCKAGNV